MSNSKQEQFYFEVYAGAREAGLSDTQARLAASQATLETGGGKSVPGGNMFGIKAGKSWTGPKQNLRTWEDYGGRVNITDSFRAYENPFDSIMDWAGLIERRFPEASMATSYVDAVDGLKAGQRGGYATDRNYGKKLRNIDSRMAEAAYQNYRTMGADIPVPSPAPRSILDVIGTPEPASILSQNMPFEVAGVKVEPVTRAPLADIPTQNAQTFDSARFGDPVPAKGGRVGNAPSMFDNARFGPAAASVDTFDSARFGTATTNPDGMDGMRSGLTAQKQQLSQPRSILDSAQAAEMPAQSQSPSMASLADQYAQYGVGQAAMRDVSQQIGLAQDVADYRAAQGLPQLDQPFTNTPTSPPSPAAAAIDTASPVSAPGGAPAPVEYSTAGISLDAITDAASRAKTANSLLDEAQERRRKNMMMGGILGGAMLGPMGGILGLLGANMISNNSAQAKAAGYYPTAPSILGAVRQFMGRDPGNGGYAALSNLSAREIADKYGISLGEGDGGSSGRDVYKDSKQFESAVKDGGAGLW